MSLPTMSSPTETVEPVAGTTAGEWSFATPVNQVSIDNNSGQRVYILFNDNTTGASATHYDIALNDTNGVSTDTEKLGFNEIKEVSAWVPASGDVDKINIRGSRLFRKRS